MRNERPTFNYRLTSPGQAVATLKVHGEKVEFELSNVSDPLNDLLEGLVATITNPSHIWGEENSCHISWYGESSTYNWTITRTDDEHCSVCVKEVVGFFDDDNEYDLIEFSCKFHSLIFAIIDNLDRFIKLHGMLNYSQLWQKGEFPVTQFLFLKKALIDNGKWKSSRKRKDTLSNEILMLLA